MALALVTSCAPQRSVDYAAYEQLPPKAATVTFRAIAMVTPAVRKRAFYGNYGGPGNAGGKPRDEMDELFRRHDIVYYLSRSRRTLRAADDSLVAGLSTLDDAALDPAGRAYRSRAMRFFRSPACHVIGKPWSVYFTRREAADCYFHCPEVVWEFFLPGHSGMPEPPEKGPR